MKPNEQESLDTDACMRLLERVAASSHLNRAPRLRELLFYVGNKALQGEEIEVHEQEIGAVVFGRQPHYDTSQDNIVRVNATELRKRIDAYFISEGADETVSFNIPRGSYKPVFRKRVPPAAKPLEESTAVAANAPAPTPPPEVATIVLPAPAPSRIPLGAALALAAILAILSLLLWRQESVMRTLLHPLESRPALSAFWSGFLSSHHDTDIVLADTSFALVEDITGKSYPLRDYLNRTYLTEIKSPTISPDRRADLNLIASRLNGSMGDFGVAERIRALDPSSNQIFVEFAREYNADSIKRNNTILIGSRKSNPWVDLFADQMNFRIEYNPELNQSFVKNLSPRSGEQPEYAAPTDPYASVGYSIIAYLPNPSRTNNSLIIEGTNSQATDAAGEFITSEKSMDDFRRRFPNKQFKYFEILLRTTRLNGTPFNAEIITYRIY